MVITVTDTTRRRRVVVRPWRGRVGFGGVVTCSGRQLEVPAVATAAAVCQEGRRCERAEHRAEHAAARRDVHG